MLATTKSGFRTGEAVSEVLRAWGIDPEGTWPHPPGPPWSAVPFFRPIDGSTWNSVDFLHNCLRPALLHLQRRGMGDLNGLDLSVVYVYSLKNPGVTLAASRFPCGTAWCGEVPTQRPRPLAAPLVKPSGDGGALRPSFLGRQAHSV